jgi:protein subunit release factor B
MRKKLFSVTIKDCKVDTFTVGGHGGSGKDTSNTGVRILHPPSGATGKATESRSQLSNKRTAFTRMAESNAFRAWVNQKAAELSVGKTVEELVEEAMDAKNLKVEVRTSKGWEIVPAEGE